MAARHDHRRIEREAGGDRLGRQFPNQLQRLGRVDLGAVLPREAYFDKASFLFKLQHGPDREAQAREDDGRSDIGVPGKWHLGRAIEDAHACSMRGIVGRKDKCSL